MNCFQARQPLLTDPSRLPSEVADHVAVCPRCATTAAAIRTLDQRVAAAIEVTPPAGFESRLKLAARQVDAPRRRWQWAAGAALAASVALAALIVPLQRPTTDGTPTWGAAMVAHLEHDPMHALGPDTDAASDFRDVVDRLGGQVSAIPDGLTRARLCILEGKAAMHAVIESAGQRMVIYLVPGVTTQDTMVELDGWRGQIASTTDSTVAVFGELGETGLRELMRSLEGSVRWGTATG